MKRRNETARLYSDAANFCSHNDGKNRKIAEISSLKSESNDEWLTTPEAAAFLKISPKFLLNLASYGRVPFYKFGRSNRYLKSELEQLLRAHPKGISHGN